MDASARAELYLPAANAGRGRSVRRHPLLKALRLVGCYQEAARADDMPRAAAARTLSR